MESLPAEILQEIVGHLSGDDLDSVRLVNRELSGIATVFKYRTLRVSVSRKGLDHLLFVSQRPALAYCVREIIYPWGYLPPVSRRHSRTLSTKYGSSLDIAEVLGVARVFAKWYSEKVYATQTKLEDSGECFAFLEAALPRMSNIRVLRPFFCQGLNSVRGVFDKWRARPLTPVKSRRRIIDMDWDIIWVHALSALQTKDGEARGTKNILDLISISYRMGLKPDGFVIEPGIIKYHSPVLLSTFFADNSGVLQFCAPLIENLTSLSLHLDGPYQSKNYTTFDGLEKTIKEGRLHKFLSSATNLRFLSLFIHFRDSVNIFDKERQFSLLHIFGNRRIWKNLHTLHLRTPVAIFDVQDLLSVLRRNSGNLGTLSLEMFSLSGGTWRDHYAPRLVNLTSLSLCLKGPYKSEDPTDFESLKQAIKASRLHKFLVSAPNLRFLSLRIIFHDLLFFQKPPLSLLDIFGNTFVWKYLRTLHFRASHTIIDVKELVNVLKRHSGTLDTLTLDVNSLSGGTWRDLLDTLIEHLQLTQFHPTFYKKFLRCSNSRMEFDRMMEYVLHGYPDFDMMELDYQT
ncbi:hypothetical protein RUND412_005000 [Rhizina undulata]